ncbi:tyrosine-type recombinase/integrase [Arsenicicoccus cauae]|uniref:tyrosine-type recombinase/integrase n=1 Tax=Arsenicicoccus cauae TaxID=2663847 RepID=UPI0028A26C6F|nr:site-specific integrase [Arsenicicoccus cauae]
MGSLSSNCCSSTNCLLRRSVSVVGSRLVWTTPKTHQVRSVPVPPALMRHVEEQCRGKGPEELVFTSPRGGPLRLNNWRRRVFDPAVERAGLVDLTPHDLRHTAASLAIASGANVKAVQQMRGHTSAAMTLDVYAGVFPDDLDAVGRSLDALVPAQGVPQMCHNGSSEALGLLAIDPGKGL